QPVSSDGALAGYVELSEEVKNAVRSLPIPSGTQLAVVIRKASLNEQTREAGVFTAAACRSCHTREAGWDRLPRSVVIYASQGRLPDAIVPWADGLAGKHIEGETDRDVVFDGKDWQASATPLLDASGAEIGHLLVMRDISTEKAAFARLIGLGGTAGAALLALPLPDATWQKIAAAYRDLGRGLVAVRSSALHEDSEGATAAGLQETHLAIEGEEAVAKAIVSCFASLYQERAMGYLARLGRRAPAAVAVLVQRMVPADTAGVLFTADPVQHEVGVMLIEAALGLCTAVVDGSIAPDVFRVDRDTGAVRSRSVGHKGEALRVRNGGLARETLEASLADQPALGDSQLRALAELGRAVESAAKGPRDIEWAFEGDTLWVLQSRPIVGGATKPGDDRGTWVWSNVNVGEALPGVALPLTWSVGAGFSELGFRQAFAALGCKLPPDAELVRQFHGRIYLNLTTFMRITAQVPFLDPKMLLELGGGGGLDELKAQAVPGSWARFLWRAPMVGARFVAENAGLDARLDEFERHFIEERRAFEHAALGERTLRELGDWLARLERLLDRTGALMLTCASGSLSSIVAIRGLLHAFARPHAARLERELLTGIADLESALPGLTLCHIAETARREPEVRALFERCDPATLTVEDLPRGQTRRSFEAFLRAYGHRAPREAELSAPRWREAPQVLLAVIRSQLDTPDAPALARVERQLEIRGAAERELEELLPGVARTASRHLLTRARRFIRLRERLRGRVTEVLGFFRTLALEVSARMLRRDATVGPDAAFYLHLEELRAFLRAELIDFTSLVAARRADVARDLARPDPPSMFVGSPPPVTPAVVPAGDVIRGIPASPGCVVAKVRVLRVPADGVALRPGEVLVAPVADVGWTPLFLSAAAVVTELGGALSHAALVAREYGVPTVVNAAGVMRALNTGDTVRVDADRGVIEILARVGDVRG
ncbi:MAG: PEP/pyruvate-binding domain-containing protein, partial [Deltaproteobacteria bacterium]